ncbi:MAG: SAM-dependent methyltransferase [Alphaproteobacteria bacterium CG_4_10_14_0_2_um_filter_63_37]|nr:MAG: hypothetical protein AUJ55_09865 [Proteobacteria bacterium CG1_02_64_396]PJA23766.1 MAG: SAM-dependent methyltransferase [Alphaproteobacteria bacterium CG_4_10_14_0_2_um_filter_63_37]
MTTFNWNAQDYAANATAQAGWAASVLPRLALRGDERILDIGCGNGAITAQLAAQVPQGVVVGMDASPAMVALARASHTAPNLSFIQGDAQILPTPGPFDWAFSNAALHWVPDHRAMLTALHPRMAPGGRLLFSFGGHGNAAAMVQAIEAKRRAPRWRGYFDDFSFAYTFPEAGPYRALLEQCGWIPESVALVPKAMRHDRAGLAGWIRTTWLPWVSRIPTGQVEDFVGGVIDHYCRDFPADEQGIITVAMCRLEALARVG